MGNRIHETHGKNKSLAIWISKDPPASELANFLSAKKFSLLLFVLFCGFLNPARMTEQEEVLEEVLLLTISEEEEPLGDDEEVPMEEVDNLLEDDPPTQAEQVPGDPVQEEQEPQEEHIIEPNPNDTTMEVDSTTTFGDLVGEIIESIVVNGDKSPREPCVIEVDLAEETNPANGDKSPGNLEIEVIENSSEAEPDEIEIMDSFGINFSRNNSTPPPPKPLNITKIQRLLMSLKSSS